VRAPPSGIKGSMLIHLGRRAGIVWANEQGHSSQGNSQIVGPIIEGPVPQIPGLGKVCPLGTSGIIYFKSGLIHWE
jgi:hypothetical protein